MIARPLLEASDARTKVPLTLGRISTFETRLLSYEHTFLMPENLSKQPCTEVPNANVVQSKECRFLRCTESNPTMDSEVLRIFEEELRKICLKRKREQQIEKFFVTLKVELLRM